MFARRKTASAPDLFLYDVTSTYLEGGQNAFAAYAAYGYNRDRKGINFFDPVDTPCYTPCRTRRSTLPACGAPIWRRCSTNCLHLDPLGNSVACAKSASSKKVVGSYRCYLTKIGRAATAALCRVTQNVIIPALA